MASYNNAIAHYHNNVLVIVHSYPCMQAMKRAKGPLHAPQLLENSESDESIEETSGEKIETVSDSSSVNSTCNDDGNLLPDVELVDKANDTAGNEEVVTEKVTLMAIFNYKTRKILIHGSFYVVGVCILIAGGVASRFHPHVDSDEYSNCTTFNDSSYI